MVSTTSNSDSNQTLNPKNPKNAYQIGGLQVEFPYQPYGTQLAFMSRVISTLDRAQRDGHCHALLESPTGTGKSLSLLCSVLAWQQNYKSRLLKANLSHSNHQVEIKPSDTPLPNDVEEVQQLVPTIFYASRTHAQITQVICEYRKTSYRVPMAVLGSRKRYCTNHHVQGKDNVDEKCRLLLRDSKNIKCPEYKCVNSVLDNQSLKQNGGLHDIEDLVKIGEAVRGCSYFASRRLLQLAELVFCPYSYIIDPVIREKKRLKGAIIIFDEAHNMEDITREAGSIDLEVDTLFKLQNELEKMSEEGSATYEPLCEVIDGLISWIERRKDSLAKRDSEHYFSGWTGDKALREFEESNITKESMESFDQAITNIEAAEIDPDMPYLSVLSFKILKELSATFSYFFSRNGCHVLDYQLVLQRFIKKGDSSGEWTHTFSLWCMNPSIVFKDLANLSPSIILTSGTLSPMNSFSSELGMQFGACLEAPHVIDANLQVWAGAISNGPGNCPLNASYKTADVDTFQDAIGKSLEEICTIVPGGSLVFFPSYKLMEKLCTRWRKTGQWSRLCLIKELFIEPRGGTTDEFPSVLKEYYHSISGKTKLVGRNRIGKRAGLDVINEAQDDSKKGAAFLAVCRGKVSEGIDFTDDYARAVIVIGIPFSNLHDIQIELKRKYNDAYKSSKNLLGGSDWYCQQAYRALNQAAGRCIRHRYDYGAIIFLDERYRQQRNRASISKWLRQSINLYDNFGESMQGLKAFFNTVKERVDQSKDCKRNENQFQNKSSHVEPKDMAGRKMDYRCSNPQYNFTNESNSFSDHKDRKPNVPAQPFIQVKEEAKCCKQVVDIDCGGCCEVSSVANCDESSSSATSLRSLRSPDQFLKRHISSPNLRRSSLGAESSPIVVTPERYSIGNLSVEAESILNKSVNSHALKRRKFTSSPVIINLEEEEEEENSNAPSTRPPDHTSFTQKIEFGFGSSEPRSRNYKVSCSLCKSPLGHPENHSYLYCCLTRSSKKYLLSLLKETSSGNGSAEMPTSVSVVMTDCSSVNQRLCGSFEGSKGVWCEEDGCVFNSVFCPFCSVSSTCLGVKVIATDSSNVQFQSKILFFADQVDVTEDSASRKIKEQAGEVQNQSCNLSTSKKG